MARRPQGDPRVPPPGRDGAVAVIVGLVWVLLVTRATFAPGGTMPLGLFVPLALVGVALTGFGVFRMLR